jgi:hypothetical protein
VFFLAIASSVVSAGSLSARPPVRRQTQRKRSGPCSCCRQGPLAWSGIWFVNNHSTRGMEKSIVRFPQGSYLPREPNGFLWSLWAFPPAVSFTEPARSRGGAGRSLRTTIIVRSCMPSSAFSSAGAQGLPSREVAPRRARSIKSRRLTRAAQWSAPTDCRSSTTPPCGGLPINRKKARHQGSENT